MATGPLLQTQPMGIADTAAMDELVLFAVAKALGHELSYPKVWRSRRRMRKRLSALSGDSAWRRRICSLLHEVLGAAPEPVPQSPTAFVPADSGSIMRLRTYFAITEAYHVGLNCWTFSREWLCPWLNWCYYLVSPLDAEVGSCLNVLRVVFQAEPVIHRLSERPSEPGDRVLDTIAWLASCGRDRCAGLRQAYEAGGMANLMSHIRGLGLSGDLSGWQLRCAQTLCCLLGSGEIVKRGRFSWRGRLQLPDGV